MSQNSLLRWWIVGLITLSTSLVTGGCAGPGEIVRSGVLEEVRETRAQLKQEMTLAEVREALGTPYFQNDSLRVEAYRKTGTDVDLLIVLLPIPVPGDKHTYYFFIAYDQAWKVFDSDVGTGRFRLVAADLVLVATSRGDRPEILLATKKTSWQALSTPPRPGTCALILLSNPVPMERVLVDGVQVVELGSTTRETTLSDTFSRHEIDAGEHALEVAQQSEKGRFRRKFSCNSGTFAFVRLEARIIRDHWWGPGQEGQIVITTEPPPDTNELRQILAHGDDWYGFPESDYASAADRPAKAPSPGTKRREP